MTPEPIVITGIGLVSPLGCSVEQLSDALEQGRSGIGPLQHELTRHLPVTAGGEAWGFTGKIEDFGELSAEKKKTIRKGLKVMCREIQMGVAAAQRAFHAAGLEQIDLDVDRTGVIFGSDYITTLPDEFEAAVAKCLDDDHEFHFSRWGAEGIPQVSPLWLLKYLPNMPACHVAIYNDLRGANNSITVREASANLALGESWATIRRGIVDRVLAGATGSRLHPLRSLHVLLQEVVAEAGVNAHLEGSGGLPTAGTASGNLGCRPFDRQRTGMVLGEGAAVLTLETLTAAGSRAANHWGQLVGWGSSAVADRRGVSNRQQALSNAMQMAMEMAGLSVDQIGHVHAHGLGTQPSDREEGRAIESVFKARREPIPVMAAKSYFGNLGAGSGMVELIVSLLALRRGRLYPILQLEEIDDACFDHPERVHLVTTHDVPAGTSVLNINVTPQGQASAVIVSL